MKLNYKISIAVVLFVCGVCTPTYSYALNLGEILTQIRLTSGDNDSTVTNRTWTDLELTARVNIVQDKVANFTHAISTRGYITTIAEQREYVKPTNCVKITRVSYAVSTSTNAYVKLKWTSVAGQDFANDKWEKLASREPTDYYEYADKIGLVPTPSSTYAGDNRVKLDYECFAAALSDSVDIPFNGQTDLYQFHDILINGVLVMCYLGMQRTDVAATYKILYDQIADSMRIFVESRPDKRNVNFVIN